MRGIEDWGDTAEVQRAGVKRVAARNAGELARQNRIPLVAAIANAANLPVLDRSEFVQDRFTRVQLNAMELAEQGHAFELHDPNRLISNDAGDRELARRIEDRVGDRQPPHPGCQPDVAGDAATEEIVGRALPI